MKLLTFKGGVHPPERKELASSRKIEVLPPPSVVKIFLANHGGAPAKPLVQEGDTVKVGQKIGEASGFISANVHASLAGVVRGIEKILHPVQEKPMEAIVIEKAEGEENWEFITPHGDFNRFSPREIVELIKEAGIVGLGGAMFPTHVKLTPPEGKTIDLLIINGAECEPYLTIDHRLMLEKPKEIARGIKILMHALGVKRAIIGIESNKPDAVESMRAACQGEPIEVAVLKTKYPQGAEKQLIYAISGRVVPAGGLPLDMGVVVQNVGTCLAVYNAVEHGIPLVERGLTVTGKGVKNTANLVVRIGTLTSTILEHVGGLTDDVDRVLFGGPMMGIAIRSLDTPILKGTSGITALTADEVKGPTPRTCIRCSRCVEACPMNLQPYLLDLLAKKRLYDQAVEQGLMDCIECGSCSYICPSGVEHVKSIKLAKKVYRALRGGGKK
ncbi:MAG: H+/Na+-translocating ferredoxin:NAD+ oxidoreductase subunit [Thermotogota bacterium]|nr:H+/Na+-translocating ferredoxin:NAD+ oxidoreductase subunit [Thermotogota bacterium]MDK2864080.1 H+/Na+-translocating ferredoxin:NAD+ oxidoreductase subunit [Thermotogota bacterium]